MLRSYWWLNNTTRDVFREEVSMAVWCWETNRTLQHKLLKKRDLLSECTHSKKSAGHITRIPNPESRLNFERKELLKISFPNDRNLPSSWFHPGNPINSHSGRNIHTCRKVRISKKIIDHQFYFLSAKRLSCHAETTARNLFLITADLEFPNRIWNSLFLDSLKKT